MSLNIDTFRASLTESGDDELSSTSRHTYIIDHSFNGPILTSFLMLNTMIGSGILNQPSVFEGAGIIPTIILFILAAYFTWLGVVVLIECGEKCGKLDFSVLSGHCYGRIGQKILQISIIIGNFGALMSYIDVVGGTASDLLVSWGCTNDACGPYSMTALLLGLFVFPVCLQRVFGHLAVYSVVSIFSIVLVVFLVLIGGPIVGGTSLKGKDIHLFNTSWLANLGSIVFAFSMSFGSFQTYDALRGASPKMWRQVSFNCVVMGFILLVIMGLAGYLSFGTNTQGVILENFTGHYADFFKIMVVVHLVLYIPVDFVSMRQFCIKIVGIEEGQVDSPVGHIVLTFILLFISAGVVLLLRNAGLDEGEAFSFILNFTGGLAGSISGFVLPAAFYVKMFDRNSGEYYWQSWAMLIFGVFVAIAVPVMSVLDII